MGTRRVPHATLSLLLLVVAALAALTGPDLGHLSPGWAAAEVTDDADETDGEPTREGDPERARAALDQEITAALDRASQPTTAPLTGVEISGERLAELEQRPAATVKIPNDAQARPHTGIEEADVVYEQETEGGTTRFAAVFHSTIPEVVGNIRSARFVDVPLVAPYDAVFVYAGARGEVLDVIEEADLVSVGAGGPGYFTDTPRRQAPHHLYSRLAEAIDERPEAPPAPRSPWRFDDDPPAGGHPVADGLRVLMSPIAATGWEYDDEARVFRRLQNDEPHEVTGQGRIGAANVVLLDITVDERDSHDAPVYELDGRGDALLLRDGAAYEIGWAKDGVEGPLELVDDADEASLRPGPTWVMLTYDGTLDEALEDLERDAADDEDTEQP